MKSRGLTEAQLAGIELHLFPGKMGPLSPPEDIAAFNRVFSFWRKFWNGVMSDLGSHQVPGDEFFRQDRVLALTDGPISEGRFVAFICLNQYNLEASAREHPYLKQYNDEFYAFLESQRVYSVWSGQFITVTPEYAPRATLTNFAAVILGLMHEAYREYSSPGSALISVARTDNSSANVAKRFGWRAVGEAITMHGVPVDQIALVGHPPAHEDERVNSLITRFWKGRNVYGSGYEKAKVPLRVAG